MVPFDRASVMLVEDASRVSVRAIFDGDRVLPLTAESRSAFNPTDHPIVRRILTTGMAVLVPDLRARPRLEPARRPLVGGQLDGRSAVCAGRRGRTVFALQTRPGDFNDSTSNSPRRCRLRLPWRSKTRSSSNRCRSPRFECSRFHAASSRLRRASGSTSHRNFTTRRVRP